MRRLIVGSLVFAFCVTVPVLAAAQGRVPREESTALGIDVGALVPRTDSLDNSLLMNLNYDYYVTPRVSVRSSFGWADAEFRGSDVDSLRQLPIRMDVNYNWEGGRWHPFVGAGIGAYFLQFRHNGQTVGDTETRLGVSPAAGVEYFFNRTMSWKAEARYQVVTKVRGVNPSGLALTAGLKTYF